MGGWYPGTSCAGSRDGFWALPTATTVAREESAAALPNHAAWCSGLGRWQVMEVSINQVKHQLINCLPPVSHDLREKKHL